MGIFKRDDVVLPPDPFGEPPREEEQAKDPFFEGVKVASITSGR
jgi:hypothetical protein